MSLHQINISQLSSRPVSELFTSLADHENLTKVFMIPVRRIKDGDSELNGVGSVRRMGPAPLGVEETVTASQTDELIEYRISRNGGPIQNHRGRLDFSSTASGSKVDWHIEFEAPLAIMGQGIAFALKHALSMGLKRIA